VCVDGRVVCWGMIIGDAMSSGIQDPSYRDFRIRDLTLLTFLREWARTSTNVISTESIVVLDN